MHRLLLADLAAIIAQNGRCILAGHQPIASKGLTDYWVATRGRVELWNQTLARNRSLSNAGDWIGLQNWWRDHMTVLEDVLVSDLLTRVIAAIGASLDEYQDSVLAKPANLTPITHAIHLNQLEVRNRVQLLMLHNRGCRVVDAVRLNRLRRAAERWTDAWLGRFAIGTEAGLAYSFDRNRAAEHACEAKDAVDMGSGNAALRTTDRLMQASMRQSFLSRMVDSEGLTAANERVASSVLSLLPINTFDSWGLPKSLRMAKLTRHFDSAENDGSAWSDWLDRDDRPDIDGFDELSNHLDGPSDQRWYSV